MSGIQKVKISWIAFLIARTKSNADKVFKNNIISHAMRTSIVLN